MRCTDDRGLTDREHHGAAHLALGQHTWQLGKRLGHRLRGLRANVSNGPTKGAGQRGAYVIRIALRHSVWRGLSSCL
jgi:hypothetical protein